LWLPERPQDRPDGFCAAETIAAFPANVDYHNFRLLSGFELAECR